MQNLLGEDLMRFIVLILPGLWALWVYKPFLLKSTEEVVWDKDLALAMSFGFPGYLAVLSTPGSAKWPLVIQVVLSTIIAVTLAVVAGKMHRSGKRPSHFFASRDSRKRDWPEDVPQGRGVAFIFDDLIASEGFRKDHTAIALIYSLGNREEAMVGEILFKDERHNEIVLDCRPELTIEQIEENHWDLNPWARSINLDSGIVVEIANVEESVAEKFRSDYNASKAEEYERTRNGSG